MPHPLTQLAAVITENISHTIVLLWRDASIRIIFESGSKMDTVFPGDVDSAIRILLAAPSPLSSGQVSVHFVPAETTTEWQVLEWIQTIPEVSLEFQTEGRA